MAIGAYNDSIFILGGSITTVNNQRQMTEYQIEFNNMVYYGPNYLSHDFVNYGTYYAQLGHMLYIMNEGGASLSVYDMKNKQMDFNFTTIPVKQTTSSYSCLAATKTYLIVTSAGDYSITDSNMTIQTFSLIAMQWTNNIQSMNQKRFAHSCIVDPVTNILYVIGGDSRQELLDSVETVHTNASVPTWSYIDKLSVAARGTRAVLFNDDMIFVIGGRTSDNVHLDIVQIINTVDNTVSMLSQQLPYTLESTAAVVVHGVLYCFGGLTHFDDYNGVDTWFQYGKLSSSSDTQVNVTEFATLEITIAIASLFFVFGIVSWLDAKYYRINNYFNIKRIISAYFACLDTVMDFLFAVFLTLHFDSTGDVSFLIAMILSYIFILIPVTFSIIQLVNESQSNWVKDDNLRQWLIDYNKILYGMCIMVGSSYTAVEIVNCNALMVDVFGMGLRKQQLMRFVTNRLYGVVCLENIPQAAIQIWYLTTHGFALTPVLSITFSLISIVVTLLTLVMQRKLIDHQECVKISFCVSGEDVKPALATIINGVKSNIALLFGLNKKLIEIPRATPAARNGLSFEMYLFLNDSDSKESKYRALLNELVDDGRLGDIFKSEWSVSGTISVQNAKLEIVKSRAQQRQDNTSNTE
eukprot:171113_1